METTIYRLICLILRTRVSLLSIAITLRAKFEGWLKFELADQLSTIYSDTRVEEHVNGSHIDIHSNNSLIELKTPNASYVTKGCIKKTCTITDNIDSIIADIDKLNTIGRTSKQYSHGYIAFVLFPIDTTKYLVHINRVVNYLGTGSHICHGPIIINGVRTYVLVARVF